MAIHLLGIAAVRSVRRYGRATAIFAPEGFVVFDSFFVVDGNEVALVIELEEGRGVVFNMIDEEDAVEVVDFVH